MTHNALVIGASGGIGSALASVLESRGARVTRLSRRDDGLELTDPASVERLLGALDGPFETVLVATGALEPGGHRPEKALRQINAEALAAQFALNATGPALVLRHLPRLLPRDRPSRFAALSARVGSIGDNRLGGWHGYRAAKAALNQLVHGAAIELARSHHEAVCVVLHPGTVATRLTETHGAGHARVPAKAAAAHLLDVLDGLSPADTGGFFDWAGKPVPW
ncbi:SDR family NAD(P)-dependent oxidoreductase [Maritimibacter sp. HL-12]|jgi:NAD(P)-dependent dehydrogenase (short-subunit alcohol dehydrogenase family)|uniref:SDR family NAD(P)-dependent oxidoreductase n=1 Tax=Maritimibacter sp. HL-12 TaxID=1162418 RepID=UPI000A0F266E|nr:SDR family NAD(P)-dependent oxidoreductase [Maritimibacter sp. HL-12]SMH50220.1 NAD(P)-dependent dehydrogenase, short-chain alcohol dehydrogenase family [Maritimibacter sp. HL-12]